MHDEVRAVGDSPRLSALVAKTVAKALQLMAEKAEYMAFAGQPPSHSVHKAYQPIVPRTGENMQLLGIWSSAPH